MGKGIFITGTGTDIGKTYVTALLVKKLKEMGKNPAYYKAAMSGNEYYKESATYTFSWKPELLLECQEGQLIPGDAAYVKQISGILQPLASMCPYIYEHAVSPHLASRIEGNPVKLDVVKKQYDVLMQQYGCIVMEGSGGILCPICFDEEEIWLEDVISMLNLPSLIVADAGLGTINNVVLTIEYMKQKHLLVKGILLNHYHKGNVMEEDNIRMIEHRTGIPVWGYVEENGMELLVAEENVASLFL